MPVFLQDASDYAFPSVLSHQQAASHSRCGANAHTSQHLADSWQESCMAQLQTDSPQSTVNTCTWVGISLMSWKQFHFRFDEGAITKLSQGATQKRQNRLKGCCVQNQKRCIHETTKHSCWRCLYLAWVMVNSTEVWSDLFGGVLGNVQVWRNRRFCWLDHLPLLWSFCFVCGKKVWWCLLDSRCIWA